MRLGNRRITLVVDLHQPVSDEILVQHVVYQLEEKGGITVRKVTYNKQVYELENTK